MSIFSSNDESHFFMSMIQAGQKVDLKIPPLPKNSEVEYVYHDDCKEKWQSHESHLQFKSGCIEDTITSYGADKKESLENLVEDLESHIVTLIHGLIKVKGELNGL